MRPVLIVPCALFAAAAVVAQTDVVVPAAQAGAEGDSARMVEGLGHAGRQQILVHVSHLAPLAGRRLTALTFRRDHTADFTGLGGEIDLVVRVGAAGRTVTAPSRTFADNVVGAVEVFRGRVTLPAASPSAPASAVWTGDNAVRVQFTTPYAYAGGDLCVDLAGAPVGTAPIVWYPDAVSDATTGIVTVVGTACGPFANPSGQRTGVGPRGLVPGETARFTTWGTPGAFAILGLGGGLRSQPLDLALVGAPGCTLHVDPLITLVTVVSPPPFGPELGGLAQHRVPLPAQQSMLGVHLGAQWLELAGAALTASEALDCTVATQVPGLGIAVVSQLAGREVDVDLTRAPVLRLSAQ
ncbi:MAG: hypothetical protein IPM29_01475 [Planctomycetes bacterium]|nr:hypothetical protein [Planctomycetota bacterium]